MDPTHLHLLLNHFPILGTLFGLGLLAYGLINDNESITKSGLVIFVLIALITIPVFLTGEPAEETVEDIPGVSHDLIHDHEELAEVAIWVMELLGLLALITIRIMIKKNKYRKYFQYITLILGLTVFGLMAQVGNLGGEIMHSEIRDNFNQQQDQMTEED